MIESLRKELRQSTQKCKSQQDELNKAISELSELQGQLTASQEQNTQHKAHTEELKRALVKMERELSSKDVDAHIEHVRRPKKYAECKCTI